VGRQCARNTRFRAPVRPRALIWRRRSRRSVSVAVTDLAPSLAAVTLLASCRTGFARRDEIAREAAASKRSQATGLWSSEQRSAGESDAFRAWLCQHGRRRLQA
jgi:hypothetical protein